MPSPPAAILGQNRAHRAAIVDELRRRLPRMESAAAVTRALPFGLAALDAHLPQGGLTVGALHEIAPQTPADTPAAFGFLAALLARFMPPSRPLLLVASPAFADHGHPHGHGLNRLGLDPARLILVETKAEKQALWAMEEALRSAVPAAVAGMVARLDLKSSQRLHLAAGAAGLPLVLLRPAQAGEASAAATRWRVGAAEAARDRFGLITRAGWKVTLERCRNGRPGEWLVEFDHAAYRFSLASPLADPALSRHPGLFGRRAG
ncbi:MAG: protein ImuA [Alphaproteobacteria bacterium]|nr:protein ImuA [Alphaproteobacteria bacterium]